MLSKHGDVADSSTPGKLRNLTRAWTLGGLICKLPTISSPSWDCRLYQNEFAFLSRGIRSAKRWPKLSSSVAATRGPETFTLGPLLLSRSLRLHPHTPLWLPKWSAQSLSRGLNSLKQSEFRAHTKHSDWRALYVGVH